MGGAVPFGYRVENRALHIVEEHAEFVRALFRRYLEIGSVVRLKAALDAENFRLPVRVIGTGRATGGGLSSRGHIYWILSNPIYVGQLRHKGLIHDGLHPQSLTKRSVTASNSACGANANKGGSPSQCRVLSRRQALRRPGQSDGAKPCRERRTALALLCLAGFAERPPVRRRIGLGVPAAQIEKQVFDAVKGVSR